MVPEIATNRFAAVCDTAAICDGNAVMSAFIVAPFDSPDVGDIEFVFRCPAPKSMICNLRICRDIEQPVVPAIIASAATRE